MPQDVMGLAALAPAMPGYVAGLAGDAGIPGRDTSGHDESGAEALQSAAQTRFAEKLLTALVAMAVRSKRRQADLSAVMNRSGLQADPEQMREALRELEAEGLIENIVPLYDGGVLLLVTSRGIDKRGGGVRWSVPGVGMTPRG